MKYLLKTIFLMLAFTPASAKEYLGFNLCGKMTATQIAKVAAKPLTVKVGQIPEIKNYTIQDYQVGKEQLEVEVKSYKDLIFEIEIDLSGSQNSPSIDEILDAKYGPINDRESNDGIKRIWTQTYNTFKSDPNLDLTFNIRSDYLGGKFIGGKTYVTYLCLPVYSNVKQALKTLENKAIREAEGKTKF